MTIHIQLHHTNMHAIHIIIGQYTTVALCVLHVLCDILPRAWSLGVWGELASRKRLFNPPPQFSRLGTQGPALVLLFCVVLFVCVLHYGDEGGYFFLFFL